MLMRLRETDGWNRRFNKLPVIFAKLSLRVTGADEAEKADTLRYLESVVCEQTQLLRKLALFDIWNQCFMSKPNF
ncbi:hypothetical protein COP2_003340 [Malus domestica]